jgi:predicted nucleic acid-binding Zn ribbon protein
MRVRDSGMKKCIVCGKEFDGLEREVCSWQCDEKRLSTIRKKLDDTIKRDKGHTKKMSDDTK